MDIGAERSRYQLKGGHQIRAEIDMIGFGAHQNARGLLCWPPVTKQTEKRWVNVLKVSDVKADGYRCREITVSVKRRTPDKS
jgi:hypothetical protein